MEWLNQNWTCPLLAGVSAARAIAPRLQPSRPAVGMEEGPWMGITGQEAAGRFQACSATPAITGAVRCGLSAAAHGRRNNRCRRCGIVVDERVASASIQMSGVRPSQHVGFGLGLRHVRGYSSTTLLEVKVLAATGCRL